MDNGWPDPELLFVIVLASVAAFASAPPVRRVLAELPAGALIQAANEVGAGTAADAARIMPSD